MTEKQIKLAVLLQDLEFGGTQRYALHLLKHLDRSRFSPELWVLRGGKRDMDGLAGQAGIKVVRFSEASWVDPAALIRLLLRLLTHKPDILYTLTAVPNIWGRVLGRLTRVPALVSGYRGLLPNQKEKYLWRLSDRIICNARVLRDVMADRFGVDPARVRVIPNAVDTDFFTPPDGPRAQEPTIVYIGRLHEIKDPLTLSRAFKIVCERMPEARLQMIGNGPLGGDLAEYIRANKLTENATLIPGQGDVRPFLRQAWVFALTSLREASPNVIIEAMATGLPTAASRVGGVPELVTEGETGRLFEVGDHAALAEILVDLLSDREKRERMGVKAREMVLANHSLRAMVEKTEEVLLEALNKS
ncbi:MAG: glycosyltransferase family 4 protein [Pseudomonadota bacterium]